MEKILKQDLEDGRTVIVAWEAEEYLSEDETIGITTEDILEAIIECEGTQGMMDRMRIMDALDGMREVFFQVRRDIRKAYYKHPWKRQPKRIPPKVAVCSSRHKGRKCKKKRK